MSGINRREKKYAKKMRNQPSNVTFSSSDPGAGRSGIGSIESQSDVNYREQQRGSHGGYCHRGQGSDRKHLQNVPKFLFAKDFAQYRAAEINAMLKAVAHKSNSQFLQSLPPHLRRRAMSDNVKRLPRRLREIAKKEMEKIAHLKKEQSKSKSRKARRRHGNLLLEFNRRQRRNIWLETHIWHAKRFHMVKKWGYCLANKPTSKSYRACYRAMTQQCLLQDMSYYCCLELNGTQENLLKALAPLSSREAGPTFASVDCLSGKRQGSLVLYKAEQYPEKPLGPITFLWRPKAEPENHSENRQLWIWAHPALKMDLLTELQLACQCSDDPLPEPAPTECNTSTQKGAGLKRKLQDKVGEKVVPKKKIIGNSTRDPSKPVSWTSLTTGIVIEDLTMEILRYRLIGPLSHSAILEVFQPAVVTENSEVTGARASPCWWSEYCRKSEDVALHNRQGDFLQLLSGVASPAEISTGSVLGLTVRDPRLNIPENRTAALPDPSQFKDLEKVKEFSLKGIPSECAQSQIWDRNIRNIVTETKISEQELNQMKSKLLVPGSQLNLGPQESKIPILLVQQPGKVAGKENIGWGSGWDILFPKGWGMAFWIPLIYRGVRVGGLQEGVKHCQYQGIPRFPDDFPDCPAGMRHSEVTEKELMDKYKRYPPAKRPNYIHYGTMSPFRCPWQQLVEEWEEKSKATGVKPTVGGKESELKSEVQISNKKPVGANEGKTSKQSSDKEKTPEPEEEMEEDSENVVVLEPKIPSPKDIPAESGHVPILRSRKLLKQLSAWCRPTSSRGQQAKQSSGSLQVQMAADVVNSIKCSYPRFLVWARLSPLKKGCPIANATICIPSEEDLQLTASDSKNCAPQEPKHRDPFKRQIKTLKKKKKGALPEDLESGSGGQDLKPVSSCRKDLVLGLWPDQPQAVMSHCSRLAIGYVSQGDFSLNVGCGEALGFVSLLGLLHMLSNQPAEKRGLVLVRNPASLQYRLAKINIEV
ncbi:ribonucleases P/MRP protein subunit POP1 isoform X2 [Pristis pectinata]|nr:ribonucleases P/MRP protein subunit POP1 isoform X2 [Pristis pectinata]XP_051879453.1 ribonucleases P/MRP protein subunit POP1 isoform X2 [Pristis pectinata]XP_051879455.1 ribonucleases P/MRP protein subunit POP1 isoform X2 [Pristis pectinata]